MSVRRAPLLLAAVAAGALLLLAARPGPAPPRAAPPPRAPPTPAALANRTESAAPPAPAAAAAAPPGPAAPAAPADAPAPPQTKPAPAPVSNPAPAAGAKHPIVYTKDVYVAGHERPHPEICPSLGADLKLLILVTSAPSHEHARDAVRLTWGHYASRKDVALAFFIGTPQDALRPALDAEDAMYGDVIVGRFVDTYSNLTLKTVSMLEWADTYCPRAPRILKTDDDMFINVPRLLGFIEARSNATKTIWGKVVRHWLPKRTTKSKYYVSPEQYPGKVFPEFATGPAYLLTADAARAILRVAPAERFLRLEDVFATGVCAIRARVRRQHTPEFLNRQVRPHPCMLRKAFSIHMVRYSDQLDLWKKLLDDRTKCPS